MARLQNKIALITGGAQGIGAAIAQLFVKEGAFVIVTDILDHIGEPSGQSLGKKGCYYHLDVSQESDWQKVSDLIMKRFGKLDILINNAGIIGLSAHFGPQDPEHASLESWRQIHAINLDGVFLGCKHGIALMKQTGGSIINMSSRSGVVGVPGTAAYASSKAAVKNHTKSVALYCAEKGYNIRCNALLPAAILTPLWEPMLGSNHKEKQEGIAKLAQAIPLKTMGEPLDVAYGALYLASDESKFITGTDLLIDGGILAGTPSSPKPKD